MKARIKKGMLVVKLPLTYTPKESKGGKTLLGESPSAEEGPQHSTDAPEIRA
jgi:hypothetical protein